MKNVIFVILILIIPWIDLLTALRLELEEIEPTDHGWLSEYWETHRSLPTSYKVLQHLNSRHKRSFTKDQPQESLFLQPGESPDLQSQESPTIQLRESSKEPQPRDAQPYEESILSNDGSGTDTTEDFKIHSTESSSSTKNFFSPSFLSVLLPIGGVIIEIPLTHSDLTAPGFVFSKYESPTNTPRDTTNCILTGRKGDSWAVISSCSNMMGIVYHNGMKYHLEDVSHHFNRRRKRHLMDSQTYVLFPLEDDKHFMDQPLEAILPHIESHSRQKRRDSKQALTVELGLFIDQALHRYITKRFPDIDPDIKTIEVVMTLINAVHILYDSSSLGSSKIKMQIKRISVLGKTEPDSEGGNIYKYLENFCSWQTLENSETAVGHWDLAILMTAEDLWSQSREQNSTVGLAYVGGMCSSQYACVIVEATSYTASFIIAHEVGHNLGMRHDKNEVSSCKVGKYLMSPMMASGATTWSTCSKKQLDRFLEKRGSCLKKTPLNKIEGKGHEGELPGLRADPDEQCHYMFGKDWSSFTINEPPFDNLCAEIWCRNGRKLKSPSAPALEGSKCGNNKVCRYGKCQNMPKETVTTPKVALGELPTDKKPDILSSDTTRSHIKFEIFESKTPKPGDEKVIFQLGDPVPNRGPTAECRTDWIRYMISKKVGLRLSEVIFSFLKIFGVSSQYGCEIEDILKTMDL